jgi:Ca2+-transporting ATPase
MLIFVIGIISIDVIQEWKTDKTLNALKDLSAPTCTVVRDGKENGNCQHRSCARRFDDDP